MEKIKNINWTHQSGYIPVSWKADDYLQIPLVRRYHDYGQEGLGFSTAKVNYDTYGNNLGVCVPDDVEMPKVFWDLCNHFDLKETVCSLSCYYPGMLLPWHSDDFPTYAKNKNVSDIQKIVRIMVFLHDQQPGHQLWVEDKCYFGDAGYYVGWQGGTKHMAANLGETNRYVLQLTGIND